MKAVQLFKQQKQRIKTSKNKTTVMFDAEHFFLSLNLDILTLIFFFIFFHFFHSFIID